MKRFIVAFILLASMFFTTAEAALILEYDGAVRNYTGSIYELEVNGNRLTNLPLEPIIFNDRALVPVREIFEAMGATVDYEAKDKSITITHGKKSVFLKINSYKAKVNNVSTNIPDNVTPKLIAKWGESAKTMVPVRFISESLGMTVDFSEREGLISITDPDMIDTQKPSSDNCIKSITYAKDDDIVQVKITAKNEISQITKPGLTEAGVLYTDVSNMTYEIKNRTEVDLGAVLCVRLGMHDDSTRIAIDTDGMKKYSVDLSSDKKSIIFKISKNANADIDTETELPTESPKPTAKPTKKPVRPAANPGEMIVVIDAGHGGSDPGVVRNRLTEDEMDEWNDTKNSPTPTPSSTPSAKPTDKPTTENETVSPSASPEPSSSPKPTIWDGGTGKVYKEKDIALSVAKKVKKILEDNGVKVIMTREGDTYPSLEERPELAINEGAVLFLSLHVNSTNDTVSSANGIEVYYSTQNNDVNYGITSKEFAKQILDNVISTTKASNRGVKTANYLVIRKGTMPSALIEMGFLNNPEEFELLISESYHEKIAKGISTGIIKSLDRVEIKEEDEEELLKETDDEDKDKKNKEDEETEDE